MSPTTIKSKDDDSDIHSDDNTIVDDDVNDYDDNDDSCRHYDVKKRDCGSVGICSPHC